MKTRQLALSLAGAFALAVFGTAVTHAYVLFGPRWAVQQVPYYVNPSNGDGIPEATAIADIQAAGAAWSGQSTANIVPVYVGTTNASTVSMNNRNEIFFRNESKNAAAATTYWWSDSNNRLIEADIVIWDATYTFVGGDSPCSGGVYLQDVVTHEFGHALGLAHSPVASATMYSVISWCSTSMRSLDPDDLAGIEALYPSGPTNTPPSVTINTPAAGSSVDQSTSISFSGSATDKEDGTVASGMVWTSNIDGQIGTGPGFTRTLSVGTHTIKASVTDSRGASAETQRSLTVTAGATQTQTGITLRATPSKTKGSQTVDLSWSGAASPSIDVYRNGARIVIVDNASRYVDALNRKGSGSYTYQVCESGTSTCSNQVVVRF